MTCQHPALFAPLLYEAADPPNWHTVHLQAQTILVRRSPRVTALSMPGQTRTCICKGYGGGCDSGRDRLRKSKKRNGLNMISKCDWYLHIDIRSWCIRSVGLGGFLAVFSHGSAGRQKTSDLGLTPCHGNEEQT
jgi:hypothetical protein